MTYIAPVPITHSSIAGNVPDTAGELTAGALAVNVADGALYTKDYYGNIKRIKGDPSGDFGVNSGKKIYLDGINCAGDTYLVESSANVVDIYVGGVMALRITATGQQSPKLVTPDLGTPSALVATNASGTAPSLIAGNALTLGGVPPAGYALASHAHPHSHTVVVGGTTYTTSNAL